MTFDEARKEYPNIDLDQSYEFGGRVYSGRQLLNCLAVSPSDEMTMLLLGSRPTDKPPTSHKKYGV